MKRFRWDIVLAALILAAGWIYGARLDRYEAVGSMGYLDRWTGLVCIVNTSTEGPDCFE